MMKSTKKRRFVTNILIGTTLLLSVIFWAMPAVARGADEKQTLDDMVVTSTKIEKSVKNLIDPVTLISEEEIEAGAFTDFTEVLRYTPSIEFKRSGGPGQYAYTKMRGLTDGYFLVLIDGVVMNEAGGGVGHIFARLDPALVEKVEILRGTQAALYGSSAMTGVISITTKGGVSGMVGEVGAEYGSLDWMKGYASLRGSSGNFSYGFNLPYIDSGGVQDHEMYRSLSPHAKLSYSTDTFDLTGSMVYMDFENNYAQLHESYAADSPATPWWGFEFPDPDQYNETETAIYNLTATHRINDRLSHKLSFGATRYESESGDDDNGILGYYAAPVDNFSNPSNYSDFTVYSAGRMVPIYDDGNGKTNHTKTSTWLVDYNLTFNSSVGSSGGNILLLGADYKDQDYEKWGKNGEAESSADNASVYINDQLLLLDETLILSGGVRNDSHEEYGSEATYKLAAAYLFPTRTKLYANYGTAFKSPTFFQLYDPTYGNAGLKPETGNNWELGLRQDLMNNRISLEAVYFNVEVEDVITYVSNWPASGGTYTNADRLESNGLELAMNCYLTNHWHLRANYTYTDSKTLDVAADGTETASRTVQVARNKWNFGVFYDRDRIHLGANLYYSGPRLRWNGDKEMEEYYRVDVSGRYTIREGLDIYCRIQNLFDTEIVEGLGYEEPGFYGIVGVSYKFDFLNK